MAVPFARHERARIERTEIVERERWISLVTIAVIIIEGEIIRLVIDEIDHSSSQKMKSVSSRQVSGGNSEFYE